VAVALGRGAHPDDFDRLVGDVCAVGVPGLGDEELAPLDTEQLVGGLDRERSREDVKDLLLVPERT
jgi:hypothetical protein